MAGPEETPIQDSLTDVAPPAPVEDSTPPTDDVTPPVVNGTPPVEDANPPPDDTTPPVEDVKPPVEDSLLGEPKAVETKETDDKSDEEGNNDEPVTAIEDIESLKQVIQDGLPEGVEVSSDALEHFAPIMLEAKIGVEGSQKLGAALSAYETNRIEGINAIVEQQRVTDAAAVKADAEFGGVNFDTNMSHVRRMMSMPGGDEVNDILRAHGIDNNPQIVKFFARAGSHFAEDTIVSGVSGGSGDVRPEDAMFPKTKT